MRNCVTLGLMLRAVFESTEVPCVLRGFYADCMAHCGGGLSTQVLPTTLLDITQLAESSICNGVFISLVDFIEGLIPKQGLLSYLRAGVLYLRYVALLLGKNHDINSIYNQEHQADLSQVDNDITPAQAQELLVRLLVEVEEQDKDGSHEEDEEQSEEDFGRLVLRARLGLLGGVMIFRPRICVHVFGGVAYCHHRETSHRASRRCLIADSALADPLSSLVKERTPRELGSIVVKVLGFGSDYGLDQVALVHFFEVAAHLEAEEEVGRSGRNVEDH